MKPTTSKKAKSQETVATKKAKPQETKTIHTKRIKNYVDSFLNKEFAFVSQFSDGSKSEQEVREVMKQNNFLERFDKYDQKTRESFETFKQSLVELKSNANLKTEVTKLVSNMTPESLKAYFEKNAENAKELKKNGKPVVDNELTRLFKKHISAINYMCNNHEERAKTSVVSSKNRIASELLVDLTNLLTYFTYEFSARSLNNANEKGAIVIGEPNADDYTQLGLERFSNFEKSDECNMFSFYVASIATSLTPSKLDNSGKKNNNIGSNFKNVMSNFHCEFLRQFVQFSLILLNNFEEKALSSKYLTTFMDLNINSGLSEQYRKNMKLSPSTYQNCVVVNAPVVKVKKQSKKTN